MDKLATWSDKKIGGKEAIETAKKIYRIRYEQEQPEYGSNRGQLLADMAQISAAHKAYVPFLSSRELFLTPVLAIWLVYITRRAVRSGSAPRLVTTPHSSPRWSRSSASGQPCISTSAHGIGKTSRPLERAHSDLTSLYFYHSPFDLTNVLNTTHIPSHSVRTRPRVKRGGSKEEQRASDAG
jgi:hypothetical protein